MTECKFKAYEGNEKYMFISYAHKDSDVVYAIMNGFMDRGYRQWYDAGIDPGTDWPENIATHLQNSEVCVACVSKNYIDSQNCKREITFALSKNKPLLVIFLEDCEMPAGLEMQLSAQQCVFYHKYKDEEQFYQKACAGSLLDSCLLEGFTKAAGSASASADAQYINTASDVMTNDPSEMKGVISEYYDEEKPAKEKKEKKPISKVPFIIAGIAVAAFILIGAIVAAGIFILPKVGKVKLTEDYTVDAKDSYLYFYDDQIDKDTIRKVNRLKNVTNVSFNNCVFEVGALKDLAANSKLEYITISSCVGIDDFSSLNKMTNLSSVIIKDSGLKDGGIDLTQLTFLRTVEITNEPEFTDISCIAKDSLSNLTLSGTGVNDISYLEGVDGLSLLDISNTQVTDINPIAHMNHLGTLAADNLALNQPIEKFECVGLYNVSMNNCGLTSLEFLADIDGIIRADLGNNKISDLSQLNRSASTIDKLDVSYNPLSSESIGYVSKYVGMERINLSGIKMTDTSVIKNMSNLTVLIMNDCGLEDISGLAGHQNLTEIWLNNNNISDIAVLGNVADVDDTVRIILSNNNITDVSKLPKRSYSMLALHGNKIDGKTLPVALDYVSDVSIDYSKDIVESDFVKSLGYGDLTLVDVPDSEMAEVTILYGNVGADFLSNEDATNKVLESLTYDYF